MKFAIISLLALIGLVLGFLFYRILIRSRNFANLIGGAIEPPPETPEKVISYLDDATNHAGDCANRCDETARSARDNAETIRKRLR